MKKPKYIAAQLEIPLLEPLLTLRGELIPQPEPEQQVEKPDLGTLPLFGEIEQETIKCGN